MILHLTRGLAGALLACSCLLVLPAAAWELVGSKTLSLGLLPVSWTHC